MSSKNMTIDTIFDGNSTDAQVERGISGIVKIKSDVNVTIDSINGLVSYELKGKMSPHSGTIGRKALLNYSKQLNKGQIYEFPFAIDIKSPITAYKGRNASIRHKLEVEVNVHSQDYKKVNPGFFSNLKKLITNDSSVTDSRYFHYDGGFTKYRMETGRLELTRNFEFELAFFFAVGIGAIIFFFLPDFRTPYVVISVLISALLGFLFQLIYLEYTRLNIEVELTNNDDNTFTLKPILSDNRYDYEPTFYYAIYEEVVDNRGTSSVTHESRIYLSGHKTMVTSIKHHDIIFNFPEQINLDSKSITNFRLFWVLFASRKDIFGLEAEYEVEVLTDMVR